MLDGKFIRGTTPTHTFILPFHTSLFEDFSVAYREVRTREVKVKRDMTNCEMDENVIAVTLTQEESLSFTPGAIVEVQLKVYSDTGEVLASPSYRLLAEDVLDERIFGK